MQIEITPRYEPVDWIKQEQTPGSLLQIPRPQEQIVEHYNVEYEEAAKNQPIELIMWDDDLASSLEEVSDVPVVEAKIEQNHLIVPTSIVKQRIPNELMMVVSKQFSRSLFEDDSKWYLLPSGNYFSGTLKNSVPLGIGTYILHHKLFFGEVDNHKPSGKGVLITEDWTYQG